MAYEIRIAGSVKLDEKMEDALRRIRIRPHSFVRKLIGDKGYKLRAGKKTLYLDIGHEEIRVIAAR